MSWLIMWLATALVLFKSMWQKYLASGGWRTVLLLLMVMMVKKKVPLKTLRYLILIDCNETEILVFWDPWRWRLFIIFLIYYKHWTKIVTPMAFDKMKCKNGSYNTESLSFKVWFKYILILGYSCHSWIQCPWRSDWGINFFKKSLFKSTLSWI